MDNQDIQEKSDAKPDKAENATEDKKSNRKFTMPDGKEVEQSDFDQALFREVAKMEQKYAGFESMQKKLDTLQAAEKERELAAMTEAEKLNTQLTDANALALQLQEQNKKLNMEIMKSNVLSDTKYINLPNAYRKLIQSGETVEDVRSNADIVLEEFQKDFQQMAKPAHVGAPVHTPTLATVTKADQRQTQIDLLKAQMAAVKDTKFR